MVSGIGYQLVGGAAMIVLSWASSQSLPQRQSGAWKNPPAPVARFLRRGGGSVSAISIAIQLWGWAAVVSAVLVFALPMSTQQGAAALLAVDGVGLIGVVVAVFVTWLLDRR
jgi:hypothetical protein